MPAIATYLGMLIQLAQAGANLQPIFQNVVNMWKTGSPPSQADIDALKTIADANSITLASLDDGN